MKRVQCVKTVFGGTHVKRRVQVDVNHQHVICSLVHAKNVMMVTTVIHVLINVVLDVIQL